MTITLQKKGMQRTRYQMNNVSYTIMMMTSLWRHSSVTAAQITSISVVRSTSCFKFPHYEFFVRLIHCWPVDSLTNVLIMRIAFSCHDVIIVWSWRGAVMIFHYSDVTWASCHLKPPDKFGPCVKRYLPEPVCTICMVNLVWINSANRMHLWIEIYNDCLISNHPWSFAAKPLILQLLSKCVFWCY